MSAISPELERVMREVGAPTSQPYQNLRAVIESSPVLMDQLNTAVQQQRLKHFATMPANQHAGASYDPATQTINLKQQDLIDDKKHDWLTRTLGHEIQHGFNREQVQQGLNRFSQDKMLVLNGQPIHDYTPAMARMLAVNRNNEASAQIAGWNALASRVKHGNPNATLEDVAKVAQDAGVGDFVQSESVNGKDQFAISPGLTLNADLSITPNASNIEAAAAHFFDKIPERTHLGHNGNSDYTNFYAAALVGNICQTEMRNPAYAGRLTLDMQRLKLQEPLLEQNGITLTGPGERCAYYDTASPQTERHFDHTVGSHRHVPTTEQFERQLQPEDGAMQQTPSSSPQSQPQLRADPGDDVWARVDRMLAAAETGDWKGFRADTQALAAMPAAQEMRAQARATVDMQEQQQVAQQALEAQLQAAQQQDAPAMRMAR